MKKPADTLGERPFALLNASVENDLGVDRRQQMALTHIDEGDQPRVGTVRSCAPPKQVVLDWLTKVLGLKKPPHPPAFGGSPLPQGERAKKVALLPSPLAGEGGREATG